MCRRKAAGPTKYPERLGRLGAPGQRLARPMAPDWKLARSGDEANDSSTLDRRSADAADPVRAPERQLAPNRELRHGT